jgi:hypothetical protein
MGINEKSIDNRSRKTWLRYTNYARQNKVFAQSGANPAWRNSFYCFLGKIRAGGARPDCNTSVKSVSFGHLLNDFGERRRVPALKNVSFSRIARQQSARPSKSAAMDLHACASACWA